MLGFSLVFVFLGISVGLIGTLLLRDAAFRIGAGVILIALGVLTTGVFGPVLERVRAPVPSVGLPAGRSVRAVALGSLVAVGWTPCVGPVLGTILTMGLSASDVWVAAILLVAYSAGLAVPFLLAAVALPRMRPLMDLMRRHHAAVQVISGTFIILVGVLLVTNAFTRLAGLFGVFL